MRSAPESVAVEPGGTVRVRTYVERLPLPALTPLVQTVWVHRTDDLPYPQRHLPTGGVALHWPVGGEPRLLGPLTGPVLETIPPRTTILGVRFRPGSSSPLLPVAGSELLDQWVGLRDLGHRWVERLGDALGRAPTPGSALAILQSQLLHLLRTGTGPDPLMGEAVRLLMPWQPLQVGGVASHLGLSASQFRRRCVELVGVSPKVLQRTLRFQGFLALAQAATSPSGPHTAIGLAGFASAAGYTDQAHLSRECLRLAGVTPTGLFDSDVERCLRDHDHAASYTSFLARARLPVRL